MTKFNVLYFIFLQTVIIFFIGCEKDDVLVTNSVVIDNSAKLLSYLEEEGDVINHLSLPVIQAEEVFSKISEYLIIDIRDSSDFRLGHIAGAKNMQRSLLFNYIKVNSKNYLKVVIVSSSGQSAGFISALLHIAGITNVYYLNFGMASWNTLFSDVWEDRLNKEPDPSYFTYEYFPKSNYSPLPFVLLMPPNQSLKDYVEQKINTMITEGFNEDYYSMFSNSSFTYNFWIRIQSEVYTICTGPILLYISNPLNYNIYHLDRAILYQIPPNVSDFRSDTYLQSLPSNGVIAVYSGSGQESAFYTAYLRFLGYNAKSILFGLNNIDYFLLYHSTEITPYAFKMEEVKDYPFVTD